MSMENTSVSPLKMKINYLKDSQKNMELLQYPEEYTTSTLPTAQSTSGKCLLSAMSQVLKGLEYIVGIPLKTLKDVYLLEKRGRKLIPHLLGVLEWHMESYLKSLKLRKKQVKKLLSR